MAGGSVLVVYFSSYGQTAKVAERVGAGVRAAAPGAAVSVRALADAERLPSLAGFDVVVVGCPVYVGRHSPRARGFVQRHAAVLAAKRSAFFSVSLYAVDSAGTKAKDAMQTFLAQAGWSPQRTAIFAGALPYSKYGWAKRMFMSRLARYNGASGDTSKDAEYTDWDQVDAFAREVASDCGL